MHPQISTELEKLFNAAPPSALQRSIHQLFYHYISSHSNLPKNTPTVAEDIYSLVQFLQSAEHLYSEASIPG